MTHLISQSTGPLLAARLPDVPRWVEARDSLLSGECQLIGLSEEPQFSVIVREPDGALITVVGTPDVTAIRAAVEESSEVIIPWEKVHWLAGILPHWTAVRIILHELRYPQLPAANTSEVRLLEATELNRLSLSAPFRQELASAAIRSPIAATFVGKQAVSFCYASAQTESLWDISIDTLLPYRQRGYAALCVSYLIRYWQERGKQPVWAAVEDNPASWQLAQKLGFVPVDQLALFMRGPAA